MLKRAPVTLEGSQSWKWYWGFLRDPMACISAAHEQFGPVFALGRPLPFVGKSKKFVLALGSDANRHVLGQVDLFRPGGQVIRGPAGSAHQRMRNGILAMHGDEHRLHRRYMQPPFSRSMVSSYAKTMTEMIDQVIDRWQVGQPFDMYEEMQVMANWIAARVLFDHDDFEQSIEISKLIMRWVTLDVEARKLMLQMDLPGSAYRRLLKHADILEKAMHELIARKRKQKVPGKDVLSLLVHTTDGDSPVMDDTTLTAHLVILHGAAFVTTASALAWTMYLIAQNPGIAKALNDEIDSGLSGWPPEGDKLDSLPLLDGVIRESMRLFPPVHHTIRTATGPCELMGVPLRTGDKVILSGYITHRNPAIFEHPNRFDPSRWTRIKPGPYDYIPFSAGPRMCLGYAFAMLEMKLIVARIMQRYRVQVVPGSRIDATHRLTLCPRDGIPMTVHQKDGDYTAVQLTGNVLDMVEPN